MEKKTDYHNKMDALVNDKQTYEVLTRDPTPTLQRKLSKKIFSLKRIDVINNPQYFWLKCSVPQSPNLHGLPKLHKPNIPMRPIVSFCGSPTYELSKYLTTMLKPLTAESKHKLQSTENFINAIRTKQTPDNHILMSFGVKSMFTCIPFQLALQCTETAIKRITTKLAIPSQDIMELLTLCLNSTYFHYNGKHYKQLHGTAMGWPFSVIVAEIVGCKPSKNAPLQPIKKHCQFSYATLTTPSLWYKTRSTPFTNISTNRNLTYSLPKRLKKMKRFLF